ncbi:flavin reductase family protein [Ornithinibacillus gellani]|uniref:flavin reductase family protein n=1 Tax=Ornithinibacillus gellani TaxID=2293253 RepID=UPI001CC21B03|nr:flavin reductase family protein [Ornithinibacillus gellani]
MNDRQFRDAMGKFATGITVVSTYHQQETRGMVVNAFMSVSLDPKLIAISIDEKASMYPILQETKQFGVSILNADQQIYSMMLAKQKEKDREIPYTDLRGMPVVADALAAIACEVKDMVKAGDHMIFIAEVKDLIMKDDKPVLYYAGKYRNLSEDHA